MTSLFYTSRVISLFSQVSINTYRVSNRFFISIYLTCGFAGDLCLIKSNKGFFIEGRTLRLIFLVLILAIYSLIFFCVMRLFLEHRHLAHPSQPVYNQVVLIFQVLL
jgi:hypothetical protein